MAWTIESLREYVLDKPGAVETRPFGEQPVVAKVGGKIFALFDDDVPEPIKIALKCEPELAVELRLQYDAVQPGYHLNKRHWNTVTLDDSIPDDEVREMIDHSYDRIVASLPRAERDRLK